MAYNNPKSQAENIFALSHNLKIGDFIRFDQGIYSHVVVYLGATQGSHFVTECQKGHGVRHMPLFDIFQDYKCSSWTIERKSLSPNQQNEVIRRANSKLGASYDLISFNCEHYANLLVKRKKESPQLQGAMGLLGIGLLLVAVVKS